MIEIPKNYNPKETETKWYKWWEENGLFKANPNSKKTPYTIVIPPPNITGILHMGHALNNSIQDIIMRFERMQGKEALWLPGTDHAGIATQNVVERKLKKEGKSRQDIGREKFVEHLWDWHKQYGSTIISQLKSLGCSCDWTKLRFTMDEGLSEAVSEVFIRLYDKGLIYKGNYIINWCPRCLTALSDEEAQHKEIDGNLYYIKYPLKEKENGIEHIVVATTRPETMLGDTAIAVNPKDRKYKKLIGKFAILPVLNRPIKIIADEGVDQKFGTGAVKVTPSHDPIDFMLGKKHNLEFVNIMNENATLNKNTGQFDGMDRFESRKLILQILTEKNLLEKQEPYKHNVGHCYRCHTIVEPRISKQWFIKMKPLSIPAIDAVKKGEVNFVPHRWKKVYLNWMENIKDWCISRQIWWGHRIPVYYCLDCQKLEDGRQPFDYAQGPSPKGPEQSEGKTEDGIESMKGVIVSKTFPSKCPHCSSTNIVQDEDVLDTWFSSWLWPFSTLGWPKETEELKYFYPTNTLVTAQEIIFFWVARMMMAGFEFMGKAPFKTVYIHGTVRDDTGTKMSKSLGNIIDPLEIIEKFGADALRFSIISITAQGQDVFLSEQKFLKGRNFANKIWNASRYIMMNLKENLLDESIVTNLKNLDKSKLRIEDKWILYSMDRTTKEVTEHFYKFRFNDAAGCLYEFFWHQFCDWYIEISKANIESKEVQNILCGVLKRTLQLMHPFMPFITEEIWQNLPFSKTSIMISNWPVHFGFKFEKDFQDMSAIIDFITSIRTIKQQLNVPKTKKTDIICASKTKEELIQLTEQTIKSLAGVETIQYSKAVDRKTIGKGAYIVVPQIEAFIPLEGIIDIDKERENIFQKKSEVEKEIESIESRLLNKAFLEKAPDEIVENSKNRKTELVDILKKYSSILESLK